MSMDWFCWEKPFTPETPSCFLLILMGKTMGIPASIFPSNPVILVILGMVHCPTCRLVATVVQNSQHNKTTRGEPHPAMPV